MEYFKADGVTEEQIKRRFASGRPDSQYIQMTIKELIWPQDRVDHIAAHGVRPHEVEEACFVDSLVLRGKSEGTNPVYYVLGQTTSGRYLFCVVIQFPDGKGYPVTARPMTENEQKRFNRWKNL